jgi:hypothetical protein
MSEAEQARPSAKETRGRCHCGAIGWRYSGEITEATICNCTICRRYAALWAYDFDGHGIHVEDPKQALTSYVRGKSIAFNFCSACGNLVSWKALKAHPDGRVRTAVNLRLAEPEDVAQIPLRRFEGLHRFEDLPLDGRTVADVWF